MVFGTKLVYIGAVNLSTVIDFKLAGNYREGIVIKGGVEGTIPGFTGYTVILISFLFVPTSFDQ